VKGNVVLDVRTVGEFETGRVPGATNIDYLSPDFADRVAKLDRAKTYLVYCAGGGRSAKACEKMEILRITNSYNLVGGFRAWQKAKKPVEQ
jgi:rhodanese-related sulfurtransferase